jgi:hypothetical protein
MAVNMVISLGVIVPYLFTTFRKGERTATHPPRAAGCVVGWVPGPTGSRGRVPVGPVAVEPPSRTVRTDLTCGRGPGCDEE